MNFSTLFIYFWLEIWYNILNFIQNKKSPIKGLSIWKRKIKKISSIIICIIVIISIGYKEYISEKNIPDNLNTITTDIAIENIPEYENEIVININNDIPYLYIMYKIILKLIIIQGMQHW